MKQVLKNPAGSIGCDGEIIAAYQGHWRQKPIAWLCLSFPQNIQKIAVHQVTLE